MDTTIRGLDEETYRKTKAKAALLGLSVGQAVNDALRKWVAESEERPTRSILDMEPVPLGKGTERLSEEIDEIVYGA
ncbi:MAG: hypothetical protein ACE5QW_09480 [Thermoplasmata archaeon]